MQKIISIAAISTMAIAAVVTTYQLEAIAHHNSWHDLKTKEEECDDEGNSIVCPHGASTPKAVSTS